MMRMKHWCLMTILLCAAASWAQHKPLAFFSAVKGDSVFLFFNQSPRVGQGFIVERRGPDAGSFERLTDSPVSAVMDADRARLLLGDDVPSLSSALKVGSVEQLLIKLRTDPYYGQVATLINRRAAIVLGRFFAEGGHQKGGTYAYKASRVDRSGRVLESAEEKIVIRENPPGPVGSFEVLQEKLSIVIEWDYPKWSGDLKDLAFQFMLFRSTDGKKFQCIHDRPILRLEGMPYRFVDPDILMGRSTTYRMVAVDAVGLISPSVDAVVETRDMLAPQRPEGLTALPEKRTNVVFLKWNRSTDQGLSGYNVYRWDADKTDSIRVNPQLLPADRNFFTDTAAVFGTVHYYGVTAVDKAGNESRHSDRAHALVTDRTPPRPPVSLAARVEGHAVLLTWLRSPDPDASGYNVRRGYDEVKAFQLNEKPVADTVFTDQGSDRNPISPGGRYFYSVTAVDTMKYESKPVGIWCRIPDDQPPAKPGRVRAENHLGREIRITWNPSLSRDVAFYRVRRISPGDTTVLDSCEAGPLSYLDQSAVVGRTFAYGISAVDSAGNVGPASQSNPVLMKDFDPPIVSAFVTAVLTDHGVRVRWEPVGDFDLAGYNVYRSDLPTGVMKKLNQAPLADLEFTDTSGNLDHWYRIRSVDTSGNESEPSKAVKARANR